VSTVGKITLNGVDICLKQVKRGMAWYDKQYQNEQAPHDRVDYAESENLDQSNRTGLWQDSSSVESSAFRHKK
jgi:endonuclease YncB( thermonuclease family)